MPDKPRRIRKGLTLGPEKKKPTFEEMLKEFMQGAKPMRPEDEAPGTDIEFGPKKGNKKDKKRRKKQIPFQERKMTKES
jgi:hypothetical protein